MNVLEKCSIWLRHRPLLKNASWLWDRVRPWYDRLICALSPRGVKRLMNGTDEIRLLPELRGVVKSMSLTCGGSSWAPCVPVPS